MPSLPSPRLPALLLVLLAACSKERAEPAPAAPAKPATTAATSASVPAPPPTPVEIPLDERKQIPALLSFVSERDGNREVYLIGADGAGERRLTSNTEADYNGPGSPDGAGLLLIRVEGHEGPQQLFFQPVDGSAPRPLSGKSGRVRFPSFAPDGKWVVFESDGGKADESHFSDIYRVGSDGKNAKRLTNNPEGNFEPSVSPRGDSIVLVSSRDRVAELYRVRADGSEPVRLTQTPRDEWGARFSPDGEQLVFVSDREGADRLYTMPAAGGEAKRVSHRDLASRVVEDRPSWSPTGRRVAYVLSVPEQPSRVIVADLDADREIELRAPEGGGQMTDPVWSPDGRYLALTVTRGRDPQIFLVRADGSGLTRITSTPGGNWNPQWVPQRKGG